MGRAERVAAAALVAFLAGVAGAVPMQPGAGGTGLRLGSDLDGALRQARQDGRQVVVYVHASWCGHCRRMEEATLSDPAVLATASRHIWVGLDLDHHPEPAARYRVRGVPAVVVLAPDGSALARREGFQTPDELLALLRDPAAGASSEERAVDVAAALQRMREGLAAAETAEGARDALAPAVRLLARPDRLARDMLLEACVSLDARAQRGLLLLLDDPALAVRAAGADALRAATRGELPFDPFAPAERRAEQVEAWRQWLERDLPAAQTAPAEE